MNSPIKKPHTRYDDESTPSAPPPPLSPLWVEITTLVPLPIASLYWETQIGIRGGSKEMLTPGMGIKAG